MLRSPCSFFGYHGSGPIHYISRVVYSQKCGSEPTLTNFIWGFLDTPLPTVELSLRLRGHVGCDLIVSQGSRPEHLLGSAAFGLSRSCPSPICSANEDQGMQSLPPLFKLTSLVSPRWDYSQPGALVQERRRSYLLAPVCPIMKSSGLFCVSVPCCSSAASAPSSCSPHARVMLYRLLCCFPSQKLNSWCVDGWGVGVWSSL